MEHFITRCGTFVTGGVPSYHIQGRFEIRQRDPLDASRSWFGRPAAFLFDSGSQISVVDRRFAIKNGFDDGQGWDVAVAAPKPFSIRGVSGSTQAVLFRRRVRFRDFRNGLRFGRPALDGIRLFEFAIDFAVLLTETRDVSILGLVDPHRYFSVWNRANDYIFSMRDGIEDRDPGIHRLLSTTPMNP